MYYLLKLFPEITIKSRPVRRQMTRCLVSNVRNTLSPLGESVRVKGGWDSLQVSTDESLSAGQRGDLESALTRIPGIHSVQVVEEVPFTTFEDAGQRLVALWQTAIAGRRFRVSTKRRGNHDFTSADLERFLGRVLLDAAPDSRVDLNHPEVNVRLDVIDRRLRLIHQGWPGLGGYPLGQQGQALCLISGGFDSPVAAWKLIRRGIKTHFLFFDLGGPAHEHIVRDVAHHLWERYSRSHRVQFISVPFEGVVGEMHRTIPDGLIGVVLKRMMLRAAGRLAQRARIPVLATGDAIAQVSSQSLTNLALIDEVSELPTLRPLIAEDKLDIIATARRIGTDRFAEGMPEVCGAVSRRPNTQARRDKVLAAEQDFDFRVLEDAIAAATSTRSDRLLESETDGSEFDVRIVEGTAALADQGPVSVIDIRPPEEREADPLDLPQVEQLAIPFYELQAQADSLPHDREYLLYCDQGVMSRMQALHLADRGLTHFGVLRT
ncbi:tRNA uracil 4-sulfurtransferase ThiI [Halomonas sp. NO4]|uniref:tRNA uracil 4-sulfurtransferase ThiI n=1 Tax=Halomonas sp. NO4 TaxID=2484813 RepID=UPI0013D208FA|nr:tRNA uracil 4-sulfurtransferase ThiI [Halomonas sp. NO4]